MSLQIPVHFRPTFKTNIEMLLQQKGSKLRAHVREEKLEGERQAYSLMGPSDAVDTTSRLTDTPLMDTPLDRRWVTGIGATKVDLEDRLDQIALVTDPTSAFVQNHAYAHGRAMDRRIMAAFFATAFTGKEGTTPVAFPASQTIAVNYVESGAATNSRLTVGKLRRARSLMTDADVDETEELRITVSGDDIQSLLQDSQVTSSDFNAVKALVAGEIDTFMGFKFIPMAARNFLRNTAGTARRIPVWAKSGMLLGVGKDVETKIDERADKNYAVQVWSQHHSGATRMEEQKVIEIESLI